MATLINSKISIRIIEVHNYGVIGTYDGHKIYVDLIELSWKCPIPNTSIPQPNQEIEVLVFNNSKRHDSDLLGSVRYLFPEQNPWYDPTIYKVGDEFIGEIEQINTFGCWAVHPNGADARIKVDGIKAGFEVGEKIRLKIIRISEKHRSLDCQVV